MTGCPIQVGDGIYGQVSTMMTNMWASSANAYTVAINALTDLGSFSLDPISVTSAFSPRSDWWSVVRPLAPRRPDMTFDPNRLAIPDPPTVDTGGPIAFAAPPVFNELPPTIAPRQTPGPLTAVPPIGPPALDPVVVPDAPDLAIPAFPILRAIVLPAPPTITIPTFAGVRPTFNITPPINDFGFTPDDYTSALLDKIKQRVSVMVDGAPGLPDAAARAMRDRAFAAVDEQAVRAEQDVIEEFASRGWSAPDSTLSKKLAKVRQANQSQRNALSRDVYLEDVKNAIEDMRFAVAQGIVLEGQLMTHFLGSQQLMLDAAKASIAVAIDVMNAEVAVANLELQQFQVDATVFKELLQAEIARIDIYRAELEGAKLIGELNAQDIAVFAERVRAVLAEVELYKGAIDGAKAKADVNIARTRAFGEQVSAYSAQVEAWGKEWDAHRTAIESDLAQYRRYELATQVFGNRVKIWSDTNSNLIDQRRLVMSGKELDIAAWRARIDKIDASMKTEAQRLASVVSVYGADIDKYRADAALESVVSESHARPFQLAIEQERNRVDTTLKNAELRITQALEIGKILVGKMESVAQTASTLSAGLASAMDIGAKVSSGYSTGSDCRTSFNYQVE